MRIAPPLTFGAVELGRPLKWDPVGELFPDDAKANALRTRPRREDWKRA
jgi:hypothetical protein